MSEGPFQRRAPRRVGGSQGDGGAGRRGGSGRRNGESEPGDRGHGRDRGLWIVGAVVVALAVLLLVLFVEPLTLLDGDDVDQVTATAAEQAPVASRVVQASLRNRIPDVPDTLRSLSPLFDLTASLGEEGPFALTLRLSRPTQDQRNLGAYTHRDGTWRRLNPATLTADGVAARVELDVVPDNIAILRRLQFRDTVTGRLPAGSELSAEAVNTLTIINPVGFIPAADGSLLGRVDPLPTGVTQPVWPVVLAEEPEAEIINTVMASDQLRRQHINNILLMVQTGRFDGVDIDYRFLSLAVRDAFTSFVTELADQLHRDNRGISVHVPLPGRDSAGLDEGAYHLTALGVVVDLLTLEPPLDQSLYREAVLAALPGVLNRAPKAKVVLAVSPFSTVRGRSGVQILTQREALGLASRISVREPGPILAGQRVTLVGDSIFQDGGASGLFWDRFANAVSFTFAETSGGTATVWVENRFSVAFKLALLEEFDLGGLALTDVSADPGQANLWPVINGFLETGSSQLLVPNPELLVPSWEVSGGELTGSGNAGWVVWSTPTLPGPYEAQLIVSDGDVRVGNAIRVTVEP